MPKTITITDARIVREVRVVLDADGTPVRAIAAVAEVDDAGNEVQTIPVDINLTDAGLTFSGLLGGGSGPGNVVKDGAGQARAAKDRVQDHTADLLTVLLAKAKALRGI